MPSSTVPAIRVQPLPRRVAIASQTQQTRPRRTATNPIAITPAIVFWVFMTAVSAAAWRVSPSAVTLSAAPFATLACVGVPAEGHHA